MRWHEEPNSLMGECMVANQCFAALTPMECKDRAEVGISASDLQHWIKGPVFITPDR
jgi:hypothetical protein